MSDTEMTKIHLNLPKELSRRFKVKSAILGKSMTALVGDLIEQYLQENKEVA